MLWFRCIVCITDGRGVYFYTADVCERNGLEEQGWKYEGEGWQAPAASQTPVYRLYNPYASSGDHHYTMDAAERDALVAAGWYLRA